MDYDVIGDVHGQDLKLKALLAELGYRVRAGAYRHPAGRVAVFVGDLIDRGPGQVEVLEIVRRMEAAGSARVVMGNHELNAIGYATRATTAWAGYASTPRRTRRSTARFSTRSAGTRRCTGKWSPGSGRCRWPSIWAVFGSATRGGTTSGLPLPAP